MKLLLKILLLALVFCNLPLAWADTTEEEPDPKAQMQITFIKSFEPKCDADNLVWIGTTDGLNVVHSNNFSHWEHVEGIKETHIKNVYFELGKYWITSHNGLYVIQPGSPTKAKAVDGLEDRIIVNFYVLPNGNLIATDSAKKVYLVNVATASAKAYPELANFAISKITDSICSDEKCPPDSKNFIWLTGTLKGGLFRIDKNSPERATELSEFKNEEVADLKQIGSTIWISTLTNGLYKLEGSSVQAVQGLEKKQITGLLNFEDKLMIGTLKDGAYYLLTQNEPVAKPIESLKDESISLMSLTDKYIWVARDFQGGLYRVNRTSPTKTERVKSLSGKKVIDILPFAGKIWLRVGQDELYGVDQERLDEVTKVSIIKDKNISALKKIDKNLFFVETMRGAFVAKEEQPNNVSAIKGLENKKINAIYFKAGIIWAETYDHEIFVIKPKEPYNAILLPEMRGVNIWSISRFTENGSYVVGSNKGAFLVNPNNLKGAQIIPGTQGQSTTSIIKVCDKLWVGTLNGYKVLEVNLN
jgi:hypothetical protein